MEPSKLLNAISAFAFASPHSDAFEKRSLSLLEKANELQALDAEDDKLYAQEQEVYPQMLKRQHEILAKFQMAIESKNRVMQALVENETTQEASLQQIQQVAATILELPKPDFTELKAKTKDIESSLQGIEDENIALALTLHGLENK